MGNRLKAVLLEELNHMTSRGPFQPQPVYDSVTALIKETVS